MTIGENIKRLREAQGMTQAQLADVLGITDKAVSTWENNVKTPRMGTIQKLADFFGVPKSRIIEDDENFLPHPDLRLISARRRVPILGHIACGEPIYKPGDGAEFIDVEDGLDCDFVLVAKGDSMTGDRILDGDIVFVRAQSDVNDGEIAAVSVDDELALKHVFRKRNPEGIVEYTQLVSSNAKYAPIILGGDSETRTVRILGKAIAFRAVL